MNVITETEKQVLALRESGKTLEEIGIELGITREKARAIESRAIRKIRRASINK